MRVDEVREGMVIVCHSLVGSRDVYYHGVIVSEHVSKSLDLVRVYFFDGTFQGNTHTVFIGNIDPYLSDCE